MPKYPAYIEIDAQPCNEGASICIPLADGLRLVKWLSEVGDYRDGVKTCPFVVEE